MDGKKIKTSGHQAFTWRTTCGYMNVQKHKQRWWNIEIEKLGGRAEEKKNTWENDIQTSISCFIGKLKVTSQTVM